MSVIVVGSVRSAGATTLAMALAGWMSDAVLVEADPDGGVLALRYGLGREPGLITLAASRPTSSPSGQAILEHAQRLPGGLPVVVAPESPERTTQLLRSACDRLASLLGAADGTHVIVDAGRLSPSSPSVALAQAAATATLVVARPRADELVAAAERVAILGPGAALVLVGSGPYSAAQVAAQLGCRVIATVAEDAKAARALSEGGSVKAFVRSELFRSVRALAADVDRLAGGPPAATAADHTAAATNGSRRREAMT